MHVGRWRRRTVFGHLVGCQLHWRCRVHRLTPHASSVSKLQNARMMRSLASCVDCVQRRQSVKTVSTSRMRPTSTLVSWTCVTNRNRPLSIMMCSSIPWATAHPRSLRPTSPIWKYEDATLKSHYLQAAAVVEDWLRETHKSYPQTLTNLLSKVSARPIGVMPRQGRSRLGNGSRVVSHFQVPVPVSPSIQKQL